ncbi:Maf family protein [Gilvimarinus polysaccharolyticus]|uniref:Maf family protein n=1 Tax=Gilvimarinus polysaccharolyticus TaxID=863921 RepID=UPI000673BD90|nr:nucleoside triphosphate pyrophosphatase [Gilvimarinus polysaccharolyticus]
MPVVSAQLFLASGSPRRAELLRQIGVDFLPVSIDVPEMPEAGEAPEHYVRRLARTKAEAGWRALPRGLHQEQQVVLGADTLGVLDGQLLEKPRDKKHAAELLRAMSNRAHTVITAVALTDGTQLDVALACTEVWFRELTDTEINAYWSTGEPIDKAGGYGIQGLGAVFVREIHGSYSNVVGLPLETTAPLLSKYNVPFWLGRE